MSESDRKHVDGCAIFYRYIFLDVAILHRPTSLAGFQDIKVCAGERTIGGVQPVGDRTCQRPRGHAQQVKMKLHAWQ